MGKEDPVSVHVSIQGHSKIDFDVPIVKRALLRQARDVQKQARRLVARKALSQAGQNPGKVTGSLQKSIDLVKPKHPKGLWFRVEPTTQGIKKTGKIYYPAILYYGSRKRNIAKRANYMAEALRMKKDAVREVLLEALAQALKPR